MAGTLGAVPTGGGVRGIAVAGGGPAIPAQTAQYASRMTAAVPDSSNVLTPDKIALAAEAAMAKRPVREPSRIAMLAVLGGAWIALGFVFFITTQTGASGMPWGMARLVGGVVFSVGLLLVIITGAELFTSSTMTIIAKAAGRITWGQFGLHWLIVYVFNLVGALLVVAMCFFGDLQDNGKGGWGNVVLDGALSKVHHTWMQTFVLGIFANLAVCLAVWMAFGGKTLTDKAIAVVGPVALFVATGLEHSIANMFLLPMGVILKNHGGATFLTTIDISKYGDLTWGNIIWHNLVPVTLGNIVGGGLIAGLYQWYANKPKVEHVAAGDDSAHRNG